MTCLILFDELDMNKRVLLILDLDETLIHASDSEQDRQPDFTFNYCYVYKRPYLDEFLSECNKYYDLAVWSSASDNYVQEIVRNIIPTSIQLEFSWGRSKLVCLHSNGPWRMDVKYFKDLRKVVQEGFALERILIVDDDPEKLQKSYGNAIYIKQFNGEANDMELVALAKYLKTLYEVEDVCKIEKQHWRLQVP